MDAHSRGQADEIDPADQWVLNPQTGNYELRLDHSTGQPPSSRPRGAGRRGAPQQGGRRTAASRDGAARTPSEGRSAAPRDKATGTR
ncbi:LytR family transcriptional regulator, partial [Streptomyces sp. SID4917]